MSRKSNESCTFTNNNVSSDRRSSAAMDASYCMISDEKESSSTPSNNVIGNGGYNEFESELDLCRICQDGDSDSPLITPCKCSGSVQYVHQACLQKWIKSSDTRHCELCRCEFRMHTKLKPFTKWEKLDMSTNERRKILCSVSFHIIAITCVIWSLWVLIQRTAQEIQKKDFQWPFWTKLIVVAIGFVGGLVFMYVQCKVYVQLWRRLKAYNRVIYVQNHPLGKSSGGGGGGRDRSSRETGSIITASHNATNAAAAASTHIAQSPPQTAGLEPPLPVAAVAGSRCPPEQRNAGTQVGGPPTTPHASITVTPSRLAYAEVSSSSSSSPAAPTITSFAIHEEPPSSPKSKRLRMSTSHLSLNQSDIP